MGFLTWLSSFLESRTGETDVPLSGDVFQDEEFLKLLAGCYIRELAFESAANLIARSISKCEFKTYRNGKEERGREYYLWNIEPNRNQSSSVFIQKWIHQLLKNNEALVIEVNGQLLVADSFQRKAYAIYDDVFSSVTVEDFTFMQTFYGSDVLYFKPNQENMRNVVNAIYASYATMIEYGMNAYRRNKGTRGKIKITGIAKGQPDYQKTLTEMMKVRLKDFFSSDNAVLPLQEGWDYEEMAKNASAETTRDIRAMIDDVSDFTAKAFGIPPAILRGEVANLKDAVPMLLTFCIDPLVDMIQEEINRKRNGAKDYLNGTYLRIDTRAIMHIDLLNVATSIDKLIGSGVFCVNDILKLVGEDAIAEPWADQHWMTKNYAVPEEIMQALNSGQGGGENA